MKTEQMTKNGNLPVESILHKSNAGKPTGDHFVFAQGAHKRYDATKPVTSFKTAWNRVRRETKVSARFHDLRHILITKLAETGAGDETIMGIAGHVWRRMLSRYAHIRTEAKRKALESILLPAAVLQVKQAEQAPEYVVVN